MPGVRFKFDYREWNAFRSQAAIAAALEASGERIAAATGSPEDFDVISSPNKSRARVVVITKTPKGMEMEATDRALTKALDAGRS